MNSQKKSVSLPFILVFASICVLALGYVLMWVSNVALGGAGVANAGFVTSIFGRIAVCLVYSVILAACIVAIVYAIKLYRNKNENLGLAVSRASMLPKVLYFFAIFSSIDAGIIMFFSILGDSIVGIGSIKSNYDIIATAVEYWGFSGLGLTEAAAGMEDGIMAVIVAVLFGFITFAVSIGHVFVYTQIKNYYSVLTNTAYGAQYDKGNKPPFIVALVFAGIDLILGVVSLISGAWVEAIIKIGVAFYIVANVLMFRSLHADLRKTSVE